MNEDDLFTEALNRTDPGERATFLDQACARNSELRRTLDELLAGYADTGGTLDQPPVAPAESTATADLVVEPPHTQFDVSPEWTDQELPLRTRYSPFTHRTHSFDILCCLSDVQKCSDFEYNAPRPQVEALRSVRDATNSSSVK
jgi:hypothetical protein